jgi:macrodomain Ter protein organizer (MatP/YcbG family)
MQQYKTASHDTGVIAYETCKDSISIKFRDGSVYVYTNKSAGRAAVAEMKSLAKKGVGLTTFINQHVREHYEQKLR